MGFWHAVRGVFAEAGIIMFVLDARMPDLSMNREIKEKIEEFHKESIMVFNKVDLITHEQRQKLQQQFPEALFVSGVKNRGMKELRTRLQILTKRLAMEGRSPKVGVVGYPNVGKSSIINALSRRARTATASYAGTTKGIQWVKTGTLKILDSPGVIPFEDKEKKLGILGAKNPEKLKNPEKVAMEIIKYAKAANISADEQYNILEEYGRKGGMLKKGGVVDMTKAALTMIREWNRGKLKL